VAVVTDEFTTPLAENAVVMHEVYESYMAAGFTDQQALYLVGEALKALISNTPGPR
jgi:hypothetical protein